MSLYDPDTGKRLEMDPRRFSTVSTPLGRFATRDLRVSASERECIRHVGEKLTTDALRRENRQARHDLFRAALAAHRDHARIVAESRL